MKITRKQTKSKYKLFIKNNLKPVSITFFLTAILFSFLPQFTYKFLILRYRDLTNIKKAPPTLNDLGKYFREGFSAINFNSNIDRVDLELNMKNLIQLECTRLGRPRQTQKLPENCNPYKQAKGKLLYENSIFPVRVRSKGDRKIHWDSFENMSFKFDIRGDKRLFGFEEFSIQDPIIRNYTHEAISADFMRFNNIIAPNHKYLNFYLNGKYKGIKHLEQSVSPELIESQKRRFGPIAEIDENLGTEFGVDTLFKLQNAKYWEKVNSRNGDNLIVLLNESQNNNSSFRELLDIQIWSKYFAIIDLLQVYHGSVSKSVKFYHNPISGLIEPLFFDGHFDTRINNFIFTDLLNSSDKSNCGWICNSDSKFFEVFFGERFNPNSSFIKNYILYLNEFSNSKNTAALSEFIEKYSSVRGKLYLQYAKDDSTFHRSFLPHIFKFDNLFARIDFLRNHIEKSKTINPLIYKAESFIVINNKISRIPQIINLSCGKKVFKPIVIAKNDPITIFLKDIYPCNLNNLDFSLFDKNKPVRLNNIINASYDKEFESKFLNIPRKVIPLEEKKVEKISFTNQNLIFDNNKVFKDKIIEIKGEVNFVVTNNKSIIFDNVTLVSDSKSNIRFSGINNNGGSVVFKDSTINGGNLFISDLSSPKIKLKSLYGGINFINTKIKLEQLNVENSLDEDGVNFMYSKVNVKNMNFNNIKSDALDSDFSNLKISNISCKNIGNDCFDVSFSNGNVDTFFSSKVLDKALSIGESSNIEMKEILIKDSELGIVVKDSSSLKVDNLDIDKTKVPISLYIKKTEFNNPYLEIKNTNKKKILKNSLISFDSNLKIGKESIEGNMSSDKIKDLFYGSTYGVKTIR